jgi:hypothetical protein
MQVKTPIKVFLKTNTWIVKCAAYNLKSKSLALVWGRTIHLYNCEIKDFLKDKPWLLHELKHVEQYERYGLVRFLSLYLLESLKNGYWNNRLEVEARQAESEEALLEKFEIVTGR